MNYVTDRKQIYNNTIIRVITKLNQNKTISTTKILMSYNKKPKNIQLLRKTNESGRSDYVTASAQQASYSGLRKIISAIDNK